MVTNGAMRHTVLFKVRKKEDIPYVVEEIKKFEEDIKQHVSILSYCVSSHTSMIDHFLMQTFKINGIMEFLNFHSTFHINFPNHVFFQVRRTTITTCYSKFHSKIEL